MTRLIACFTLFATLTMGSTQALPCGMNPHITFTPPAPIAYTETGASIVIPATVHLPAPFHGSCNASVVINSYPFTFQNVLRNPQTGETLTFHVSPPFWYTGTEYMTHVVGSQGQSLSLAISINLPANQLGKSAGTYQNTFTIQMRNTVMGGVLASFLLTISATIQPSCTLPPPSVSSLDFSSAVHNGNIPAPVQRTLTFTNAGCTGPARLTLAAQPLTIPTIANAALHFTSTATLGSSTVNLDTRNATSAFTVDASAPASGKIPLAVTLLPSSRFMPAGTYTSVLKVSLEPAQ